MTSVPVSTTTERAVDAATFRRVFRQHAAGVTIVTAVGLDETAGFTATSLTSISLEPPLLSIAVASRASAWPALATGETFVVNLLGADAQSLATRFATSGIDRFAQPTRWRRLPTGEPLLEDAHSWLRCAIAERVPVGDHYLIIGRVIEATTRGDSQPLLYHDGSYHTLGPLHLDVAAGAR